MKELPQWFCQVAFRLAKVLSDTLGRQLLFRLNTHSGSGRRAKFVQLSKPQKGVDHGYDRVLC